MDLRDWQYHESNIPKKDTVEGVQYREKKKQEFIDEIKNEIQKLNGQNIAQMLINKNAHQYISKRTKISEKSAIALINNASGRINGQISNQGLRISLRLR
jgi:superfamily I DNA and/or RNA helicase